MNSAVGYTPAHELSVVELLDGRFNIAVFADLDERKTSGSACVMVGDNLHVGDGHVSGLELLLEVSFSRLEGKVADVQLWFVTTAAAAAASTIAAAAAATASTWWAFATATGCTHLQRNNSQTTWHIVNSTELTVMRRPMKSCWSN